MCRPTLSNEPFTDSHPVLLVVEGILDVAFLTRLAAVLHAADATIPNLAQHVANGNLVMLPIGGGNLTLWMDRLAPLGCVEFPLNDRESLPETARRQRVIAEINARPNCFAVLTRKRSLENYLHPAAIAAVTDVEMRVDDDRDVVTTILTARAATHPNLSSSAWRDRRRQAFRLKRLLNTHAVDHMTTALLAQRDPDQELLHWFRRLGQNLPDKIFPPDLQETNRCP